MNKEQYIAWLEHADTYAQQEFCLSAKEMNGGDEIELDDMIAEDPEEWVERLAEKYDLVRRDHAHELGYLNLHRGHYTRRES